MIFRKLAFDKYDCTVDTNIAWAVFRSFRSLWTVTVLPSEVKDISEHNNNKESCGKIPTHELKSIDNVDNVMLCELSVKKLKGYLRNSLPKSISTKKISPYCGASPEIPPVPAPRFRFFLGRPSNTIVKTISFQKLQQRGTKMATVGKP